MQTTAFPPLHSLIQFLMSVDYKKHLNNFMDLIETIVLYVLAVSYVIYQKVSEWYKNGGKDFTIQTIKKVRNFLSVSYTWVRSEGYPKLIKFVDNVMETYTAWKGLVTV
jgi:hypothetical protein